MVFNHRGGRRFENGPASGVGDDNPADGGETKTETTNEMLVHLRSLGLGPGATWDEIAEAHRRLVSDLTPGPDATHGNVILAERILDEVNEAYASLQHLVAVA